MVRVLSAAAFLAFINALFALTALGVYVIPTMELLVLSGFDAGKEGEADLSL